MWSTTWHSIHEMHRRILIGIHTNRGDVFQVSTPTPASKVQVVLALSASLRNITGDVQRCIQRIHTINDQRKYIGKIQCLKIGTKYIGKMLLRVPQVLFMQWHVPQGVRTPLWSQPLFTSHGRMEFGRTWYLEEGRIRYTFDLHISHRGIFLISF